MRHRIEPAGPQPVGRLMLVLAILAPELEEVEILVARMEGRPRRSGPVARNRSAARD